MLMLSNTNEIVHILMGGGGAAGSLQLLLFSGHFIYGGSHKHAGCCCREEERWRGLMQISDRRYIFRICTLLHLKLKTCTVIVLCVATYECANVLAVQCPVLQLVTAVAELLLSNCGLHINLWQKVCSVLRSGLTKTGP